MNGRLFAFVGGEIGPWRVVETRAVAGETLAAAVRSLQIVSGAVAQLPGEARWLLRGLTSNERYVTRLEKDRLFASQPPLSRAEA